jgi:(p)ppGpp synthase/HD superfamily hydrolase
METTEHPQLSNRFEQALVLATQLHRYQVRKSSNIPYISHLLSVAALVLEDGGDEDEAIAALLHDAVEDQGGIKTRAVIMNQFGKRVVEIVDGCTEPYTLPKPPWHQRKLHYLEQLAQASPSVLRVSIADKLHNARSIVADFHLQGDSVWKKFTGGYEGTVWFYDHLLEIYQQKTQGFLLSELERVVTQMKNLNS